MASFYIEQNIKGASYAMEVKCFNCGKLMSIKLTDKITNQVSHGICITCREEIKTKKKENKDHG